jgi:hypothetical protein
LSIRSPSPRDAAGYAVAGLACVVLAALAFRATAEVRDRRQEGFCRELPVTSGATTFEERSWWPLGDRCFIEFADGSVRSREPSWALTAFAAGWITVVALGVTAPAASRRRRLAWIVGAPPLILAVVEQVTVHPASLIRFVGISTVSLSWGAVPAAATAIGVWWVTRGRVLPIALVAWTVWAAAVFLQGRSGITP